MKQRTPLFAPDRGKWRRLSLKEKMGRIMAWAVTAVLISVAGSAAVGAYGMVGFNSILNINSKSLALLSAVREESQAFLKYVNEGTKEAWDAYRQAAGCTSRAVEDLPFDSRRLSRARYAQTWSIRSLYSGYVKRREAFFAMDAGEPGYIEALYGVYQAQDYLGEYADRLEQLTVEEGNQRYQMLRPLFVLIPLGALLWGGMAAAAAVRLLGRVDKGIIQPVERLAQDSRRIAANDFSGPEMQAEGEDEIGELVEAFYHMKASTRGYIRALKENHQVQQQLDAVRLQLLKSQIHPHFLFNTLNMIASMAQIEGAATTEQMTLALSRLFRYNLKSADSVMPLEQELKTVRDYMYIQQMRFGKRLRFREDCGEDTLPVLVPSFALQPLVENAVLHGTSSLKEGGSVLVKTRLRGGRLFIWVLDTGQGMDRERLREIKAALEREEGTKTGIGLGNIYSRVRAMYADGGLRLYSRPGAGTLVRIAFTAESDKGGDHGQDIGCGG